MNEDLRAGAVYPLNMSNFIAFPAAPARQYHHPWDNGLSPPLIGLSPPLIGLSPPLIQSFGRSDKSEKTVVRTTLHENQ